MIRAVYHKDSAQAPAGRALAAALVGQMAAPANKPAKQAARETGARYGGVLYVDSLSDERGPVPTFLKLLEVTVETVAKGFGA